MYFRDEVLTTKFRDEVFRYEVFARNVTKIHGLVEKLNKLYFLTPY